ncbi:uncharacterized protein LOC100680262 [Nasonia vitripennis]|uniref:Uncharacterized protein n=1 Tax=Nasonia vitripennis TaxID=7425 RepID=A0A7M7H6X2_NASVI|nr:uncharacterized protein LOC100680262 [Nasonia vitripennis]
MQGFCPLCSKNGIETEIRTFQINFNEAVFMCSSEDCVWPVGHEELTIINRSIGEDWSKCREKVALDNLNNCPQVDKTVPDQSPVIPEDNSCVVEEDSTTLSKPRDLSLDTNTDSESNLASQPVDLEPINANVVASPTKNKESSDTPVVVYAKPSNLGNVTLIVNGISTSLDSNFVPVKTNSLSSNNSSRVSTASKDLSVNPKLLNRARRRAIPYKKFNFNDLKKEKSTNVDKEANVTSVAASKESSKEKENLNERNKASNNVESRVELDWNSSSNNESEHSEAVKNAETDFNLDEFLNGICNDISGKPEAENAGEYDWLDSLVF